MSNPFFVISFLLSSFIVFFTTLFFIEVFLKIFPLKNFRLRANLRLIPFLLLVLDPLFEQWSFGDWLNPLSCNSCVQRVLLQFLPNLRTHLSENEISLTRYLGQEYSLPFLFISFWLVTFFFVLRRLINFFWIAKKLKKQTLFPLERKISNILLLNELNKKKIAIFQCHEEVMPQATYDHKIILPYSKMNSFSQDEFETVISHELEHLKWKDPYRKIICHLISSFFWWIPMKNAIKKMELEIEIACDQSIPKYHLQQSSLASAFMKILNHLKNPKSEFACFFSQKENFLSRRLQAMLGSYGICSLTSFAWTVAALFMAFLIIFSCILVNENL